MKKILIIKIGAIGDVIMALPMLDAARKKYGKETHITWVVGKNGAAFVNQFSVDKVVIIDEKKLFQGNAWQKMKVVLYIWRNIGLCRYERIVVGYRNWRYRIMTMLSFARHRRYMCSRPGKMRPIPGRHHSDEYVRLMTDENKVAVSGAFLEHIAAKIEIKEVGRGKKCVALAPGGAKNILNDDRGRRWPIEYYVDLARKLCEDGYEVLLTGAPSDVWVEEYFMDISVTSYIGKTSLLELAQLYRKMDLVVTHDSGPMHIAGLVHASLIALFGPTNPYEKAPRYRASKFLWEGENFACCPCYDGVFYEKCKASLCLYAIAPHVVYEQVKRMLSYTCGRHMS